MSRLSEAGKADVIARDEERRRREEYRRQEARERLAWFFNFAFRKNAKEPKWDVEFVSGDGLHGTVTRIRVDGHLFDVTWRYESGGDRAYWDDGWWPDFMLLIPRRWPRRPRQVNVWGTESIARALA